MGARHWGGGGVDARRLVVAAGVIAPMLSSGRDCSCVRVRLRLWAVTTIGSSTGPNSRIEQQLTILLRRVQSIHLSTASGEVDLDRSAYGIMCRLADEGPQRLGSLAQAFGLDPSTITRQVQALEGAGLAQRATDSADRRASILDLSPEGHEVLSRTREHRRARLEAALGDWSPEEKQEFGRLLEKFNVCVESLAERVS